MTSLERIEHASPDELAQLLHTAIRWLRDEWFAPWLDDPSSQPLSAALGVADGQQLAHLGTPYLRERLDLLAELVDAVTHAVRTPAADAHEAAARWTAVHRRGLAVVVDLYELAAVRNAQVRVLCERAGWEIEPPGLLLSETVEDAFTILPWGAAARRRAARGGRPRPRLSSAGRGRAAGARVRARTLR